MTKKKIKELRQIVLGVGSLIIIMGILAYCLNYMNPKQNVLEELEEKIKKVEQKEIILTEHEKELEKKATEKEWQEVDNSTDK
jgi:phosphoribosyl 1,2-cyclic phosphodiesterase|tara:strand:- start:359 stop:607 length:249 start_codon:yes stop_codon:yes gene_type:complete